jgi:RNA polymerase sigma factor (sigma-70 family)
MTKPKESDLRYIKGVLKGDSKILEEIYEKYGAAIFKMVTNNKGTTDDVQDVIQEAIIIVYKNVKKKDFKLTSSFFTYFYAICRNVWRKILKQNTKHTVTFIDNLELIDDTNIEQAIIKRERHKLYLKKLNELSASCRQILELQMAGKRMKEIVVIMGFKSEGYARKRKFQCKENLLKKIKQDDRFLELTQQQ